MWLLTPYIHPQPGPQSNYNRAHKRTRCVVERGIGQLKRRFHVLHGEIRLTPEKASRVISVCAILHNLCKQRNIPQPEKEEEEDDDDDDDDNGGGMLMGQDHHGLLEDWQELGLEREGQEPGMERGGGNRRGPGGRGQEPGARGAGERWPARSIALSGS
ncbi:hypothetical protein AAFF_G00398360 [Aldrovandia affinis]|uniref:DDE Tnp4 domain-containing protein n=1 Tax=Aldrovandia affinis TaxID=143900 RepID=A0AAD7SCL2_9TELE|nr:hypothetical protein AAFF_G00398360 [Aldrovandia affinis]